MILLLISLLVAYIVFSDVLNHCKKRSGAGGELPSILIALLISVVAFLFVLILWRVVKWIAIVYMAVVVVQAILLCLQGKRKLASARMVVPIIFAAILLFRFL